ncbi:MAG: PDZ domain-containing protein [Deltaproteobacteria bacterium]|nr:PDZ domain-containing protein [Deltaproteobacteria bacterium]
MKQASPCFSLMTRCTGFFLSAVAWVLVFSASVRALERYEPAIRVIADNVTQKATCQIPSIEGRLGVRVRPVTPGELEQYGLDFPHGLVITSVHPDSPLAPVGFEARDMILEINGRTINDMKDFASVIKALGPGQQIIILGLDHRSGRSGYVQVMLP